VGEVLQGIASPLVFDTSALFNFGHRGQLQFLLDKLASVTELLVPEDVLEEATQQEINRQFYQDLTRDRFQVRKGEVAGYEGKIEQLSSVLGSGELSVIVLTLETKGAAVIDEPEARAAAQANSLKVVGTLGILTLSVRSGWITDADALEVVQRLRSAGFRTPPVQANQSFGEYISSLGGGE